MGFPGCVGSIDCTHIAWDMCPTTLNPLCKGKEGYPTLVFEVVVDHTRKIRACTRSFYGAKTIKLFLDMMILYQSSGRKH